MATLDNIPTVTKIDIPLGRGEFEDRHFYALPAFMNDLQNVVPNLQTGRLNDPLSPIQQLDDILHRWIIGKPMRYRRWLNDLSPQASETWEMKTADLRIFGWIYRPRVFVGAFIGFTDDYKHHNNQPPKESYDAARDRVVEIRNKLDLDPPKFTAGVFDALVSV
jgi:hypothetical protein